ncbi:MULTISPECIES: hypothetical protein [Paenibacillus]|uniref:hypothetical protein n=1 Tax=Paenibacillus TaxID=44249 RepID=UPI00096ED5D8|nr:hypothetical protein [Paenibacillus odorifer]OMD80432.1 hypothetical protein BSK53_20450 [Paenibacillus odorifer]
MESKTKMCGRCDQLLPLSNFYDQSNTKDKKGNYCKKCKSKYQKEQTKMLKEKNLSMYLLRESCYAAFERGKITYNRPGYENVRCSYDNAMSLFKALWDDEVFRNEWRAQTDVYVKHSKYKYRPTLDRINPELGYEKGNIRMLPQYINVSRDKAVC